MNAVIDVHKLSKCSRPVLRPFFRGAPRYFRALFPLFFLFFFRWLAGLVLCLAGWLARSHFFFPLAGEHVPWHPLWVSLAVAIDHKHRNHRTSLINNLITNSDWFQWLCPGGPLQTEAKGHLNANIMAWYCIGVDMGVK